jgi:hypothetical protein
MKRSAIAFARGAELGADDADVGAGRHRVEGVAELGITVADQDPEGASAAAEVPQQVAGLLGDPVPDGMGGDSGQVHASGGVLVHDEQVATPQEDGVGVGEVDREIVWA